MEKYKIATLKKYFLPLMGIVATLLAAWMFFRNQIWETSTVSPSETVLHFMEGRAFFLVCLRAIGLLFWVWAAYIMWKTGKSKYLWLATIFYVAFSCFEYITLEAFFFDYKKQNNLWEGGFAVAWMICGFTGITIFIFNAFAVWLIRFWRKGRLVEKG
ncbi:MAG: hypothetical protein R2830_21180 [Saprospiraceae bacterium]